MGGRVSPRRRQSKSHCPRCSGPRFKVDKKGNAYECDCPKQKDCNLCEGRGWREIAGESVKCTCQGGPELQAREFPPHTRARAGDRPTSQAAADATSISLNANQWQVYNVMRSIGPAIDQEIIRAVKESARGAGQSSSGIRTRRAELVEIHLAIDTGRTAKTEANFDATVWEAVSMTAAREVARTTQQSRRTG